MRGIAKMYLETAIGNTDGFDDVCKVRFLLRTIRLAEFVLKMFDGFRKRFPIDSRRIQFV
jgi:hypothetical protein